jgi:HrpA-like RNA helicase
MCPYIDFRLCSHHILIFLTGQEEIEAFAKSARTIAKVSCLIPKYTVEKTAITRGTW